MNPNQASVKLTYDKVKDGLFSIKLRICYQKERPRYHLPIKEGILVKPDTYKRLVTFYQTRNDRTGKDIQQLYAIVSPFIIKAETIIQAMPVFSFAKFEHLFYGTQTTEAIEENDVIMWLMRLCRQNESEGRIGNADSYKSAAGSFKRYVDSLTELEKADWLGIGAKNSKVVLRFEYVTPKLLNHYEQWMLKWGTAPRKIGNPATPASMTTVGIYTRQLRAAFNAAIGAKVIHEDIYPFGRKGFVAPTGANVKKALNTSIIKKIMTYECEPNSFEERGRDLWVLSYLSNGMNLSDICSLRWSQINYLDETITFTRNKTSRTRRGNQTKVVASLFPESKAIIERWAGTNRAQASYVFPFLNDEMNPREIRTTIQQVVKITNKYMKRIAAALGINVEIKTYEARHSFASAVLKSGGDIVYIKDKLGQSSLKSTESYLTSIHDENEQNILRRSLFSDE